MQIILTAIEFVPVEESLPDSLVQVVRQTTEHPKGLTDSCDNSGGKDNSIWPVPVVESLAASYSDPLACSIGHHLRTKKIEEHN